MRNLIKLITPPILIIAYSFFSGRQRKSALSLAERGWDTSVSDNVDVWNNPSIASERKEEWRAVQKTCETNLPLGPIEQRVKIYSNTIGL